MIIRNDKVLKQKTFKNEKELQTYIECNIEDIFGLKFVETEFSIGNYRFDTLAFDDETKSFKIIEYKNAKSYSVVDQGYTYLRLLLERKADFIVKYNEKFNKTLKLSDVDWSASRILFVSSIDYNNYQLDAANYKDIPFDLYKVTRYEGDIVDIEEIVKTSNIKVNDVTYVDKEVSKEVKVYTEEDHIARTNLKDVYFSLKDRILELGDIDIVVFKTCIVFKGRKNIVSVIPQKGNIALIINAKWGELEDPLNLTEDIRSKGHWGNGDYATNVKNARDIDNVMPLLRQSFELNKK